MTEVRERKEGELRRMWWEADEQKKAIREASSSEDQKFNLWLWFWKRALCALNWDMTCSGKAEHDFT